MKFINFFICFFIYLPFTLGKMEIIMSETIEKCSKPNEEARVFDISELELIAVSDTEIIINGSIKFLKEIKAPWVSDSFSEQFYRGQWDMYVYQRRFPDFCAVLHSPVEVWYNYTKTFKSCPLKPNVRCNKLYSKSRYV